MSLKQRIQKLEKHKRVDEYEPRINRVKAYCIKEGNRYLLILVCGKCNLKQEYFNSLTELKKAVGLGPQDLVGVYKSFDDTSLDG